MPIRLQTGEASLYSPGERGIKWRSRVSETCGILKERVYDNPLQRLGDDDVRSFRAASTASLNF